jgi:hypothetical protein
LILPDQSQERELDQFNENVSDRFAYPSQIWLFLHNDSPINQKIHFVPLGLSIFRLTPSSIKTSNGMKDSFDAKD